MLRMYGNRMSFWRRNEKSGSNDNKVMESFKGINFVK